MSDTTMETPSRITQPDRSKIELVGPTQKQRGIQLPQLLVSLLVAGLIALLVLWWNSSTSARSPVLAVSTDLVAGEIVEATDLMTVAVSSDIPIVTFDPSVSGQVVGSVARADISAGTLVSPALFQSTTVLAEGEAFVGATLDANEYPPGLAVNDSVEILITDDSSSGTIEARVSSISTGSSGQARVRFVVDREDAELVQRSASRGSLAVFEVSS